MSVKQAARPRRPVRLNKLSQSDCQSAKWCRFNLPPPARPSVRPSPLFPGPPSTPPSRQMLSSTWCAGGRSPTSRLFVSARFIFSHNYKSHYYLPIRNVDLMMFHVVMSRRESAAALDNLLLLLAPLSALDCFVLHQLRPDSGVKEF